MARIREEIRDLLADGSAWNVVEISRVLGPRLDMTSAHRRYEMLAAHRRGWVQADGDEDGVVTTGAHDLEERLALGRKRWITEHLFAMRAAGHLERVARGIYRLAPDRPTEPTCREDDRVSDRVKGVHPAAAVFPMLPDDELAELAEDIKANGLLHPIVLDKDGLIVDGRNRDAACKRAGVEPTYTTLNGHDPVDFILSANVHRRHLTEGQRAIAVVRAERFKLKQENDDDHLSQRALMAGTGVNLGRIGQAAVIVDYAPALADAVMLRSKPFSVAYQEARVMRDSELDRADREAAAAAAAAAQLERVRAADADLHLLVSEERISLDVAIAELDKREQEEKDRRQRATIGFAKATSYLHALLQPEPERIAREWEPSENTLASVAGCEQLWTSDGLRELAEWLGRAAAAWEDDRR